MKQPRILILPSLLNKPKYGGPGGVVYLLWKLRAFPDADYGGTKKKNSKKTKKKGHIA